MQSIATERRIQMASVRQCMLYLPVSPSADVVGYNMYICPEVEQVDAVDAAGNFIKEKIALPMESLQGSELVIDLATLPGMTAKDDKFNLGFTAVDDAGNESAMRVLNGVSLDFTVPDAPGEPRIIRS